MEILKDLPTRNKDNFSKHSQGGYKVGDVLYSVRMSKQFL